MSSTVTSTWSGLFHKERSHIESPMMFEPLMIPSWGVFAKGMKPWTSIPVRIAFLNQGYQGTPSAIHHLRS